MSGAVRPEARLFLGFVAVGAIGFLANAGLLAAAVAAGLSNVAAPAVSAIGALQVTFLLNGRFVFGNLSPRLFARQWAAYMLANGFGALCYWGLFVALTASRAPLVSERWPAFAIAAGLSLFVNYVGARFIAFRHPRSAP